MVSDIMIIALGGGAVMLAAFLLFRLGVNPEPTPATGTGLSRDAVPGERVELLVSGWSEHELYAILGDFRTIYEAAIDVVPVADGVFAARFPEGISPATLVCLVSYLEFPERFEPETRNIAVLARIALCPECGLPRQDLAGQSALIYVPSDDPECDRVHLLLASGVTYRIPFTDLKWHPAGDACWPAKLDNLLALMA